MLIEALRMRSLGFSVIPLKPRSKIPLEGWKEFQTRLASEAEIKEWFRKEPRANIGLVTGQISGLVVLDLDGPDALTFAASRSLTSPVTALSGSGGKHLYYKWNEELRNSASKIADGVDIRGDGGFIVVPPSIHPNGYRYRWAGKPDFSALTTIPTSIFPETNSVNTSSHVDAKPDDWISTALEEMKNGHVHNTLISILGKFRAHNFSISDTYKLLEPYALENGKPYGGLRTKIEEIWGRYEPKSPRYDGSGVPSGITLHSPGSDNSQQLYRDIQRRKLSTKLDYSTGYAIFDRLTNGLTRGDLLSVAARTGVGKTNWLIGPIRTLCESGKKVLFFSTEMSFDQIWSRYQATLRSDSRFNTHQFYICDDFAPNVERVENALKQCMPDVFIFDHINTMGDESAKLSEFMKGLKFLARKFNIPGIVAAQLNRSADWVENGERVKPRLSMIKGSGTIEETSSTVLLLSETRLTSEGSEIEGVIDKARWGDKGLVHFILKKNPYRMEEVSA